MTRQAWICDGIRTPIGRYGGALATVRPDDLAVTVIDALVTRNTNVDWEAVDDLLIGCTNQSGEDNRNVARMSGLLSKLPDTVPAMTVNRLCASGMDSVAIAARSIGAGEAHLCIAGGVESMSRAPFVVPKTATPFGRNVTLLDTTMGWRFPHPQMEKLYGCETMPQTGENVAEQFSISRESQDAFALRSQQRAAAATQRGFFGGEITPVIVPVKRGEPIVVDRDEHPRPSSTLEGLQGLRPFVKPTGTITAGNASGINDGACAMIVASDTAVKKFELTPLARVVATTVVGLSPGIMGIGPAPATRRLLERIQIGFDQIGVIELNEAFASQSVAVLRELGLPEDAPHVNPNGGAIAIGHPLGMSGSRIILTATRQLQEVNARYALCTMCVGVGQGIAMLLERA
ncbi:3-oxoadipyl-CoA thiolase [Rubripirellula sp.]|jgi:3-oxoadipyl-CoA thiolase|nr:3-oxoadipyl-CoA thiolase [Rubripirellula sp.]